MNLPLELALQHKTPLFEKVKKISAKFEYTDDNIRKCVVQFIHEMNEGLCKRTPAMCQIPTYITSVAHGTEKGLTLAVDLGGTNLRVCSVDLHGDTTFSVNQSRVSIPRELMVTQKAKDLFFFIAKQIEAFLGTYHRSFLKVCDDSKGRKVFSLGFTFSFPAYQERINSGRLLRWTKGFDIPDAVGQDVCELLQQEIDLLGLPIKITALVNDAAGTIMSRAYTLPLSRTRTSIGVILGTGTNCVYLEKLSKITKPLDGQYDKSTGEMLVSIEWGSFDNALLVLPNSSYDAELNEMSVNPNNQMFEKRVSGMFLGELLRLAVLEMHTDPEVELFDDHNSGVATTIHEKSPLYTRWAIDSSILSVAEADNSSDLKILKGKIEKSLDIVATSISVEDARAVKEIAHAIGKRAARLTGMAIGAVILQSQRSQDSVDTRIAGEETLHSIDKLNTDQSDMRFSSNNLAEVSNPITATLANNFDSGLKPEHDIVDIGVDGSVIELYPGFESYMREALSAIEWIGAAGEKRIRIAISKDGSGVGAAIIALLAAQQA